MTEKENDGIRSYLENRKGDKRFRPLSDEQSLYDGNMFYFTCIGEKEELLPVYEIFSQDDRYTCTLHQELYRPEYWCEILPKKATKAEAIRQLKRLWNCDRVVAFGDAGNDIPMFEASDECYAVSNAVDTLKELATVLRAFRSWMWLCTWYILGLWWRFLQYPAWVRDMHWKNKV